MHEIKRLIEGYQKFRQHYFQQDTGLFSNLVQNGQKPKFLVIACCDSRVDPAIITGCEPGDLFVVRNVANLVPPCDDDTKHHATSAALEFAVCGLAVKHIIVLGHSHCGGIQALLKGDVDMENKGFIASWMRIAKNARDKILAEYADQPFEMQANACEKLALTTSLNNLHSFPWIAEKISTNQLAVHAWHFDLSTGIIQNFNQSQNKFEELSL